MVNNSININKTITSQLIQHKKDPDREKFLHVFFLLISNTHLSYSVAELFIFAQNLIHAVKCIYFAYIHILLH